MLDSLISVAPPQDSESPAAFFLRTFAANRVTPKQVYRWLELRWTEDLHHEHLEALSWVTKAPLAWLRPRVVSSVPGERWQRSWCGQVWRNPAAIRTRELWICGSCLHEQGTCRLEWDLGCFMACPVHRVVLTDRCSYCGRRIRWQRPAVDVCSCKRHLKSVNFPETDFPPTLGRWLRWIADRLADPLGGLPLPEELAELFPGAPSTDGMWRVINAFGVRPDRLEEDRPSQGDQLSPKETYKIATRGLQRLGRLRDGARLSDEVHSAALRWQVLRGISPSDRALANHLLAKVDGQRGRQAWGRVRKGNQMELF